ncbi:hypothetical protein [Saccharothrix sp.]|uniref:hypothetical protein n=1 Tax=Saccharothrix sp. TaxID=1873460 RepID=UPI002810A2BD|nr:hypothetical protein [Saccharothrix sp.]
MNDDLHDAVEMTGQAAADAVAAYVDTCVHALSRAVRRVYPAASALLLHLDAYFGKGGEPVLDRVFLAGEDQVLDPRRNPQDIDDETVRHLLVRVFEYPDHLPPELRRLLPDEGNHHGRAICVLPLPDENDDEGEDRAVETAARVIAVVTLEQAQRWGGRHLSVADVVRLRTAIPDSSIPESMGDVVFNLFDAHRQDDGVDA